MTIRIMWVVLVAALWGGCSVTPAAPQAAASRSTPAAATAEPRVTETIVIVPELAPPSTSAHPARSSPQPTPAPSASDAPVPSATQAAASGSEHTITISVPLADAMITSPVAVEGNASVWPFEGTLSGAIKDANGTVLGIAPLPIQSPGAPQGGPFSGQIEFDAPLTEQTGTLALREESAKDGTIVVRRLVPVRLAPRQADGVRLDAPSFAQDVTLPLHIALRTNPPRTDLVARLVYTNGVVLAQPIPAAAGSDGLGYGVLNLQWNTESAPPTTEPGAATLQIVQADGDVLTEVPVNMLSETATQPVRVAHGRS